MTGKIDALLTFLLLFFILPGGSSLAQAGQGEDPDEQAAERAAYFERISAGIHADEGGPEAPALSNKPCIAGKAGSFPCKHIDLLSFMPLSSLGGGVANDIWGWTDPAFGTEYAILGRSTGTSFVDISDPTNPIYLGNLPSHTGVSDWRDVKIYRNRAYIVSEAAGHGLQVFDLRDLRSVNNPPVTLKEEAHYDGFGHAHNIVINEDSGFAYVVGSNTCSGGLHIINIQSPGSPLFVSCYSGDGYVHDAQCVIYHGLDTRYTGSEICFGFNEDTLTIMDVTQKKKVVLLARQGYSGAQYTHQGWLTEDHAYLFLGDEEDEDVYGHNTRTRIFSLANLKKPVLIGFDDGVNKSIDHNMYVRDGLLYESNYTSGLQILNAHLPASGNLPMVGFFDTYLADNGLGWKGSWSNFPYFSSGVVIVSSITEGLFVLKPVADIDLFPASLASYQHSDREARLLLNIANSGIGTLNWSIKEGCAAPADAPWLEVLTPSGQSTPDVSGTAQILFDSSGLELGSYLAELCVTSDDPDEGMVAVPVELMVNDWPELYLPAMYGEGP